MWVDGAPRVACVTPIRRLQGRQVTTLDGLPPTDRDRWAAALVATGGSQCGFCTPGIVMRLAALGPVPAVPPASPSDPSDSPEPGVTEDQIDQALLAHLCRCTGWQTIREAARLVYGGASVSNGQGSDGPTGHTRAGPTPGRHLEQASVRATVEGGVPQRVGTAVVLGRAGFADDSAPSEALVAVPDGAGGYAVAESLPEARALAGRVQGRSSGLALHHPVAVPAGGWDLTLRTTWVEPGYVEPDASWCLPGGEPASPVGNGGAFGGKLGSPVGADARRLADRYGRPVRVLWSREDVVRHGPKRPPVAAGVNADGTGVLRVGVPTGGVPDDRWRSAVAAVAGVAPGLVVEAVPVVGPPTSFDLRGAVWAEAAVVAACARSSGSPEWRRDDSEGHLVCAITAPGGGRAVARCLPDGSVEVEVDAGPVVDEVVLRSYCIGAVHQALGWVTSEGIAVDAAGQVHDLTIRSFGILRARDTPSVTVSVRADSDLPVVNGSDAVFAAVAGARWLAAGLPPTWPIGRGGSG